MSLPTLRVGGGMAAAPAAQGQAFSPLSDAVVLLRAATAALDGWTAAAAWRNEGTGGSTFNATVGDITPTLAGGKFTVNDESGEMNRSGFTIADADLWSPTIGTDGLTIAHDWTPLAAPSAKAYWHYDGADLATAGYGFVSEELDYGEGVQFYVWGLNDQGPGNQATIPAIIAPNATGVRRIDVARIAGNTLTLFRNGAVAYTFDLTGRGPVAEAALLKFGQPCHHYAFAAWDRALSNNDIAMLSAGFPGAT